MAASQFVTHENVFKLIEMVQSEECVWDMRCACYHDRYRKRRVVEEIGEKLQMSGKYVLLILETRSTGSITGYCLLSVSVSYSSL